MNRLTAIAIVALIVTLTVDILVRLSKPSPIIINGTLAGLPVSTSLIDYILAVEFGIPVVTELYSSLL